MIARRLLTFLLPAVLVVTIADFGLQAESTVPPPGIREHTPAVFALTHARIVTAPGQTVDRGTVVIRDGNIVAVGAAVPIPADARVLDLAGKTIYAGFIDPFTEYGLPPVESDGHRGHGRPESAESPTERPGSAYWNPNILLEQQ